MVKKHKHFEHFVLNNLDGLRFKRQTPFGIGPGDGLLVVNHIDVRREREKLKSRLTDDSFTGGIYNLTVVKANSPRFHDIFLDEKPHDTRVSFIIELKIILLQL